VKHIDSWFAFARNLGLGIEEMEEIILVTGCDRTKSWTNVAFLGNQVDAQPGQAAQPAQVSFGVKVLKVELEGAKVEGPKVEGPEVEGRDISITFQSLPGNARGAVLRHGPEGTVRLYAV
jgi:hypothetical protein